MNQGASAVLGQIPEDHSDYMGQKGGFCYE
jgi:hypothetical protein